MRDEIVDDPASAALPGRECDCPEFVEKCSHWDGKTLMLARGTHINEQGEFGVAVTEVPPSSVCLCCNQILWRYGELEHILFPTDYPSALTAFRQAELKLLGREE